HSPSAWEQPRWFVRCCIAGSSRGVHRDEHLRTGEGKVKGGFTAIFQECQSDPKRSASVVDMPPVQFRMKVVLVAALAGGILMSAASAQDEPRERRGAERGERSQEQRLRNRDALSDSVRQFERSNRGSRVLSAERIQADGRDVNRIKAMDDR